MVNLKNLLMQKLRQSFSGNWRVIVIAVLATVISLIAFSMGEKQVTIVVDGERINVATYKSSVKDVLSSANIEVGQKDKVLPGLEHRIKDDMEITIKRAFPITIKVEDKVLNITTSEDTVEDVLRSEGIVVNEKDKVYPGLKEMLTVNKEITIVRVTEEIITKSDTIAYKTIKQTDNNLEKGATKVIRDGVDGERITTIKVTYENGKEVARETVSQTIKKAPVDKIISVGALSWFMPSRGGEKVYYVKKLRMKATSYTVGPPHTPTTSGITASGMKVKRDPNGYSTVAVDPNVIPLGTRLYVEGYGYAIAADTGGAVKGNIIDLYFPPEQMGRSWSTHYTNVYILK